MRCISCVHRNRIECIKLYRTDIRLNSNTKTIWKIRVKIFNFLWIFLLHYTCIKCRALFNFYFLKNTHFMCKKIKIDQISHFYCPILNLLVCVLSSTNDDLHFLFTTNVHSPLFQLDSFFHPKT